MAKKKRNVPRTRNNERWTEARFFGFIRSSLRRASCKWPPIVKDAKERVRRPYKGKNKRQRWEYQCEMCEKWFAGKEVQVDHIVPAGQLKTFEDLPGFVERLFCEVDGLRVLCKECHNGVTRSQRHQKDG